MKKTTKLWSSKTQRNHLSVTPKPILKNKTWVLKVKDISASKLRTKNKHLDSHQVLFWSRGKRAQSLLCNFWDSKLIYPHSCFLAWLQQWSGDYLHHRVFLELEGNVTEKRRKNQNQNQNQSLFWVLTSLRSFTSSKIIFWPSKKYNLGMKNKTWSEKVNIGTKPNVLLQNSRIFYLLFWRSKQPEVFIPVQVFLLPSWY